MEVNLEQKGKTLIVRLSGELDHHSSHLFRDKVDEELNKEIALHLALDMSGLVFMDSSGLGALLGRYRLLNDRGGKVVCFNIHPQIKRIIELSGLHKVIPQFKNEKEALQSLRGGR